MITAKLTCELSKKLKKQEDKKLDKRIEAILTKDPSGVYSLQDDSTREACRKVVKSVAKLNGVPIE